MMELKEICDLQNGFAFKSGDYIDASNTLNCRMSNIRPEGYFDVDYAPKYLPDEYVEKYSDFLLKDGDLVIAMTDMANDPKILGVPTIVKTKGKNMLLNQRVGKLIIKDPKRIYVPYLQYSLNRKEVKKYYTQFAGGGLQLNVGKKEILSVKIPLPPLETQKKIAAILDAADAYRQKTKALIAKYDELTQSLFLDMFGDPVRNEKGWESVLFSDVVNNRNSSRVPIKQGDRESMQGIYPYYGATGIVDYINDFKFDGEFLLIAEDGKNLVNRKKPIAWVVNGQFWVNNHSHVVEFNGVANLIFLSYQLNSIDISQYVTGIDQFKMNKNNLNRIPVFIPPIDFQNQFAERVQKIEVQKAQAQQSLEKAEELFNSLLMRAFKG